MVVLGPRGGVRRVVVASGGARGGLVRGTTFARRELGVVHRVVMVAKRQSVLGAPSAVVLVPARGNAVRGPFLPRQPVPRVVGEPVGATVPAHFATTHHGFDGQTRVGGLVVGDAPTIGGGHDGADGPTIAAGTGGGEGVGGPGSVQWWLCLGWW